MSTSKKLAGKPLPFETESFEGELPSRLEWPSLPVRSPPFTGELLSSWLVRLAWLNGEKLHTFSHRFWPYTGSPWNRNIDLSASGKVFMNLQKASHLPIDTIKQCALSQLRGTLFEEVSKYGITPWVLAIKHRGTRTVGYGLQLCPSCLKEDSIPYFRVAWRVGLFVCCPTHKTPLIDQCPACGQGITFHEADFGKKQLSKNIPTSYCSHCSTPWSDSKPPNAKDFSRGFLEWQTTLHSALVDGWHTWPNGKSIYSLSYFEGLRVLIALLLSDVREILLTSDELSLLNLPHSSQPHRLHFELMRWDLRSILIRKVFELLNEWPTTFTDVCQSNGIRFSDIHHYHKQLPFWIAQALYQTHDPRHYPISTDERNAVEHFLLEKNTRASANNVNRWLGRWFVSQNR